MRSERNGFAFSMLLEGFFQRILVVRCHLFPKSLFNCLTVL